MRWDLVIFDCDGVLIDSELLSIRADRECLVECGIELSADEIRERYTGISFCRDGRRPGGAARPASRRFRRSAPAAAVAPL